MTQCVRVKTLSGCALILSILFHTSIFAQKTDLKAKLEPITKEIDGKVGVAVMDLKSREVLILNEKHRFPMESVFKFPLAMAVLDLVDKKKLTLDQKVHLTQKDYFAKTHSPMRDKYPDAGVDVTIADLLGYSVSQSDNIACDILFRLAGGTRKVQDYVHGLGVKNIAIASNEAEMHTGWDPQYKNWCEPGAMLQLLDIFYQGKKLSKPSTDFLWKILTDGPTGLKRIKGELPKSITVAHKTGTSGTNEYGMMGGLNDVGIMRLPNGKDIAIVMYISNTHAKTAEAELVIAKTANAVADHYSSK
jgi:beta-lactamase class A